MADGKTSETPRGLGDFIFTMEKTKEQQLKEAYADWWKAKADWDKANADWDKAEADKEKANADWDKAEADWDKAKADWWKAWNKIKELEKQ